MVQPPIVFANLFVEVLATQHALGVFHHGQLQVHSVGFSDAFVCIDVAEPMLEDELLLPQRQLPEGSRHAKHLPKRISANLHAPDQRLDVAS